eukprot:16982_1
MAEVEAKPAAPTEEENKVEPPKATPEKEEPKAEEEAEKKEEVEEENIYQEQLPNRVIVARNHPLSYYVDRARRILRIEEKLYVSGRGNTISMACTLVEVLKRQKIGEVASVSTGMNVETFFTSSGDPRWSTPTSMISFNLVRGEFAELVADYHQRKVIEIFENKDTEQSGTLTFDEIESLQFETRFKANEEQVAAAKEFLGKQKDKALDLPNFIRYASILIHPLLRDKVFKSVLSAEFDIAAAETKAQASS